MPKAELSNVLSRSLVIREPIGPGGAVCSVDVTDIYTALRTVNACSVPLGAESPDVSSWLLMPTTEELWTAAEPIVDITALQEGDVAEIHTIEWDRSKPCRPPISQYVSISRQSDRSLRGAFRPVAFNGSAPDLVADNFHIDQVRASYNGQGTVCERDPGRVIFGAFLCLDLRWPDLDPDRLQSICIGPVVDAVVFPEQWRGA